MTRTVCVTDVTEIRTVKVACARCGFAVELPVGHQRYQAPEGCGYCGASFPLGTIERLCENLRLLQDHAAKNDKVRVTFETEEAP